MTPVTLPRAPWETQPSRSRYRAKPSVAETRGAIMQLMGDGRERTRDDIIARVRHPDWAISAALSSLVRDRHLTSELIVVGRLRLMAWRKA